MGYFSQFARGLYYLLRSFKMIGKKKLLIGFIFILLFFMFFSFNSKVFAGDLDGYLPMSWSILEDSKVSSNTIVTDDTRYLYYIKSDSQYLYQIVNHGQSSSRLVYISTSMENGSHVDSSVSLAPGESLVFPGNSNFYFSVAADEYEPYLSLYYKGYSGAPGVSQSLADNLTLQNLWGDINPVVVLIGIGVLFALGFAIFKKATKGTSKHQAKM